MKKRYHISEKECHCNLISFYENAAQITGAAITDKTVYDCRKICVTKPVQKCIWDYYSENGFSNESICGFLLMNGPKANLDGDDLAFEIEEGFISEG